MLENAEKIIRHASLCTPESFFARYFLFTPPTQDVHAHVMTGRIIAVYVHCMLVGFNPHALLTICLHCNNATVTLRAGVPQRRKGSNGGSISKVGSQNQWPDFIRLQPGPAVGVARNFKEGPLCVLET